jgi:hypothetical protein
MDGDPGPVGQLVALLADDTLPKDRMRDVIGAAAGAAHGLFVAGDLRRALAAWDMVIQAEVGHGFAGEPYDRLTGYIWERARTLDHLDDLDGALEGYEDWQRRLQSSARTNLLRWADASIDRIHRKIARRDAGLPYRTHKRGIRPEALAWEAQHFRNRAAWLPWRWEQRDRQRADREATAAQEAAEEAAVQAWRASASPAVLEEYEAIQQEMRDLASRVFETNMGDAEPSGIQLEFRINSEIWARGEALGRRARRLREAPRPR